MHFLTDQPMAVSILFSQLARIGTCQKEKKNEIIPDAVMFQKIVFEIRSTVHCCVNQPYWLKENPLLLYIRTFPLNS